MKILDRYVLATFVKNYLISFMVLVGLYVLLDLVFNFDELIEVQTHGLELTGGGGGGASFLAVLYVIWDYYFYQVFLIFSQLSGVIPVVATAFTLVRFSRFNEMTAVLAAGMPLLRFAMPIILASLVMTLILLPVNQELVVPRLIPKLARSHDEIGRATAKSFRIDAMQDNEGSLLFAARYAPPTDVTPAEMIEVDVVLRDANHDVTGHVLAERAVYDAAHRHWRLTKGVIVTGLRPNEQFSGERPVATYDGVTPEEVALYRSGDYVELLSTMRINQLLARPQSYGTIDLLRVKHARVTQWVMNLVAVLLAIGCVLTREPGKLKTDGIKLVVVVGLAMTTVFLTHHLASHPPLADATWADRWPAIMAWLPIFLFGPLAIFLLDRVQTKRS